MGMTIGCSALACATHSIAGRSKYEKTLWAYQTAMALARKMLSQGIITEKEYEKIDAIVARKYGISSCSIFR